MTTGVIRHVLLDADGVLQELPGGWLHALTPYVGERTADFLNEAWAAEPPCLRGRGDFRQALIELFGSHGLTHDVDEVLAAVWNRIEVAPTTLPLVDGLRRLGLGVHLATNQMAARAAYMRSRLGYDDLLDRSYYSCDLGAAKPEPEFFAAVLEDLATDPGDVLFVDDTLSNVESARAAGLAAEHWHLDDGLTRLQALLAGHGVEV